MARQSVVGAQFVRLSISIMLAVSIGLPASNVGATDASSKYHIAQTWPLAGNGGWSAMAVDEHTHRLYVPRDTRVAVLDTDNGRAVGEIDGLTDARAIALSQNGEVGYISDGIAGTVHLFNRSTLHLISSVVVGGTVDEIVLDPATHLLFVFNTHDKSIAVVDTSSLRVTSRIGLPGRPGGAISNGNGIVFVNLVSSSQIARIDARALKLNAVWDLGPCIGPSGMAFDAAHSRIFSVCENKKMAVSATNAGRLVGTVTIGEGAKTVEFDAINSLVLTANAEGTITVVKEETPDTFDVVQTLATDPGARTMIFDHDRRRLYLISAKFGQRPGPTSEELQFRPTPVPDSAVILVISR